MTDSAETMREALKEARDTLEALRKQLHGEPFAQNRDRWLNLGMRTVDAIKKSDAALSASGTKSDGGHGGQPYASTDAVEGASAPNALSGRQEGRTGGVVGATQTPGTSMSSGQTKPITAGQAPGPSDPISSQPDEREAIARIATEWRRQLGWREFEAARDGLTEEGKTGLYWIRLFVKDLDAILAMQAERRGATPVVHAINGPFASPISKMLVDDPNSASGKRLVDAPLPPAPIVGLEPVAWRYWWRSKYLTYSLNEPRPDDAEPLYTRAQLEAHAAEQVRAEREACARIADDWRVSKINNGDLTNEQLNQLLNGIGPNIAAAIRARGQV